MTFTGMRTKGILLPLALLVAVGLMACGGGGSGGTAGGGIGGTGKSVGVISGFGSIIVNGVVFDTDSAVVFIDDSPSPGSTSDLELGMVVKVEGEFNDDGSTGTAATVTFDDVLEGPVTSAVNTTTMSFEVMGQVVFYSAKTIFRISGGGALAPTDLNTGTPVVEISGIFDSAGQVRATRVERKALDFTPGVDVLEIKGHIGILDTNSFTINALTINYSAVATSFDNGTIGDLAEGVFVEVKGDDDPRVNGLDADRIEFEAEDDFGAPGDLLNFEGYVTSLSPAVGDFEVNGLPVETDGSTQWRGGYTSLADVTVDDRVEVDGTLQDQGGTLVLLAREVELEVEEEVRFEAPVASIQATTNVATLLGIDVTYSDDPIVTEFEDKDGSITTVDELSPDDWVRLRSYIDTGGTIVATRIEKDNTKTDLANIILRGPADNVPATPGSFTILGVTITPEAGVSYKIEDSDTDEAGFFAALKNGRIVKARGSFAGGTLTANELDLQN